MEQNVEGHVGRGERQGTAVSTQDSGGVHYKPSDVLLVLF